MSEIKVGGQAFGDGVLMRTKRYWALVREDGSSEFGSVTSWLDHHPRWNVFFIRSIIMFVEMMKFGLKTYSKIPAAGGKKLLLWIGLYLAITLPLSMFVNEWFGGGPLVYGAFQFFSFIAALWAISMGMTGRIWTYHGAEHKAVNAFEQGKDIEDVAAVQGCSRIHQRCGTNFAFLILVVTSLYFPYPGAGINALLAIPYTIFALAMSLEMFRQLMRFPRFILSRVILFGGRLLQRFITTREPEDDQVVVASKALQLVLALEAMHGARS